MPAQSLSPDTLYRACDLSALPFTTTDDLEPLAAMVGQERAREALEFGTGMAARGYNLFVLGPSGLGKRSLVQQVLEQRAGKEPRSSDWCYVNNFAQPHRPRALKLPAGQGAQLRQDMGQLIEELRASIPALFESEEYRARVEHIDAEIGERGQKLFQQLGDRSEKEGIALLHTPSGFSLAPMRQGEVITPEEFGKLPDEQREQIERTMEELQDELQKAIREVQKLQRERRARLKQLNREMSLTAVGSLIDEVKAKYSSLLEVARYLEQAQADLLENIDDFRRPPEEEQNVLALSAREPASLRRYQVNVIIGDGHGDGAPIVTEDFPTYQNLLGRIEHIARFGTLMTDFALIKAGALHRANGGYLLLDARKLLTQPFSWDGLKRALSTGEIRTESLGETYGLISTAGLEPEPIPLQVKVILFGDRILYYLLLAYDPEFGELFKVAADFEDELPRNPDSEALFARFVGMLARSEKLLPFHRAAVARVIEHGSRLGPDAQHVSADLESIVDLLREADYDARQGGAGGVDEGAVERALARQERRASRVREKILAAILRGELMIDTQGSKVGQINGLSVSFVGSYAFGHPTRITATTRLGDGEVLDIQREVELGGPIHSKGVLILSSFLASRYSGDRPHALSASLVFEQTYGEVEGDSASVAELCVLLSSLSDLPLRQDLAVTGSVNQHGEVQPVGGINQKIEGFFELCQARGLTGTQGVLIPAANAHHLMLRREVREAAAAGKFRIYSVQSVDDAIELLTGTSAGARDTDGNFTEGSVNFLVASRLAELSLMRQAYASMEVRVKTIRRGGKAKEKQPPKPP